MTGSTIAPSGLHMQQRNKSFCALPWVNLSTDPDGSIKPCCISTEHIKKDDGTLFNLGHDSIESIYNSKHFQDIRTKMVSGDYVKGCEKCYESEKYSSRSNRITYNEKYNLPYRDIVFKKVAIKYFDLRFGNLCNLKCRSYNPMSSNQIGKEVLELNDDLYSSYNIIPQGDFNNWYKTDLFLENLNNQTSNITDLYITGGEPTLIEENRKFLQKLIDKNVSQNITIKISTNLTNLNKEFYNLLSKFRFVIFFGSIDGFKDTQEYLRYPSNWQKIDENIKTIITQNKFLLNPTPVIQIGNLNKIVDLFDYLEEFNRQAGKSIINVDPLILDYPNYLSIKHLPIEFKIKCWQKIEDWINVKCRFQHEGFHKKLIGIKNLCYEDNINIAYLKQFKYITGLLDNHRKQSLKECNSELYDIIYNYD